MFDPFPANAKPETVFKIFVGFWLAVMLLAGVTVRAAHHAMASAAPLPTIHGGEAGEVLKIKPTLKPY